MGLSGMIENALREIEHDKAVEAIVSTEEGAETALEDMLFKEDVSHLTEEDYADFINLRDAPSEEEEEEE